MSTIIINGQLYEVFGETITVNNNTITVDGKIIAEGLSGIVEVRIIGDVLNLNAHNVNIEGNVLGGIIAHNIKCGDVSGDIKGHNIQCSSKR